MTYSNQKSENNLTVKLELQREHKDCFSTGTKTVNTGGYICIWQRRQCSNVRGPR